MPERGLEVVMSVVLADQRRTQRGGAVTSNDAASSSAVSTRSRW
jgi:hypothetical protein